MARIRYQLSTQRELDRHAHCLCLHVRPTTIFLAVINLVGASICTMFTLYFIVNNNDNSLIIRDEINFVKRSNVNFVSLLMYLLLAFVSSMLLYAVMKSKPKYILPFFGIQFIDYLFSFPHLIATMTHADTYLVKSNRNFLQMQDKDDFEDLSNVWTYSNYSHVYTTTLLLFSFIILLKTYFLCVVWKCYRYLHLKEIIATFAPTQTLPGMVVNLSNVPPPNYEEATKLPECMPPEYTSVAETTETQIPIITVVQQDSDQTKKPEVN